MELLQSLQIKSKPNEWNSTKQTNRMNQISSMNAMNHMNEMNDMKIQTTDNTHDINQMNEMNDMKIQTTNNTKHLKYSNTEFGVNGCVGFTLCSMESKYDSDNPDYQDYIKKSKQTQ